eukprot:6476680-Amphidinium_carterae.2
MRTQPEPGATLCFCKNSSLDCLQRPICEISRVRTSLRCHLRMPASQRPKWLPMLRHCPRCAPCEADTLAD